MNPQTIKQAHSMMGVGCQIGTPHSELRSMTSSTHRETEIPARLSMLLAEIANLGQTAETLIMRLHPVLSLEEEKIENCHPSSPDLTNMGSQLSEARSRLQCINSTLQAAIVRLEL